MAIAEALITAEEFGRMPDDGRHDRTRPREDRRVAAGRISSTV